MCIQVSSPGTFIKILSRLHISFINLEVGRREPGSDQSKLQCLHKQYEIEKSVKLFCPHFIISLVPIWLCLPKIEVNWRNTCICRVLRHPPGGLCRSICNPDFSVYSIREETFLKQNVWQSNFYNCLYLETKRKLTG